MESTGARLKKIRLEKGFSLEEVQKKTKIHLNILKAIEEDNLANLSPIYIKGFLKIYCQFLGVDPHEYTQEYKDTRAVPVNLPKAKEKTEKSEPIVKVPAHPVQKKPILKPEVVKKIVLSVVIVIVAVLLFIGIKKIASAISKYAAHHKKSTVSQPVRNVPVKTAKKPVQVRKTVKIKDTQAPAVNTAQVTPPPPVPPKVQPSVEAVSGIRLGIHAKDDCWLQLKIDGKAVFQNILRKGRFEVWQANDRMELTLGNVGNVELELNGKLLPPLGRKGQPLKNIVITKDGLKVE